MPCLEGNFEPFYRKMKTEKLPQIVIDNFKYYYHKLTVGQTGLIPETEIIPLDNLANIEALPPDNLIEIGLAKLHHTVVIKLNGGLGTSYEYAFVSNSDNLGAVPDPAILLFHSKSTLRPHSANRSRACQCESNSGPSMRRMS